ncbi:MAG: phytanoyl-CoA dioxygenase family protein [Moorea sp. SIO4E2]|uniref:phytanoyl-CoA dioxygenase family protein n=1 Tax=Moorena sp. SIO4E2 TaxID=2607826 RepID=UPI0013BD8DAC|nr:phytanoyl-CoA dioxygenase family protein [Moorena sp. SIO4E2]NEQ07041.1 phytanoyl-CoA dioxygenase family protein [Moorena sp. SIO4E2]
MAIQVELPDLSTTYSLTQEQIQQFRESGHVFLPNVIKRKEIDAYRPQILAAIQQHQQENHAIEKLVQGNQENWIYINNIWTLNPKVRRLILAHRFGKIAADLLGVDAVRLFRDQTYFKKPGGTITPWHQDGYFMPLDTDKIITMWLPLVDVTPEMAPMSFADGSHHGAKYLGTSTPDERKIQEFSASLVERGYNLTNYGNFAPGDVTLHSGWTLHYAPANHSNSMREVLVIVYYADGARIAPPRILEKNTPFQEQFAERMRQQTRESCFPGLQPGDLAVTPMNPLVYSR